MVCDLGPVESTAGDTFSLEGGCDGAVPVPDEQPAKTNAPMTIGMRIAGFIRIAPFNPFPVMVPDVLSHGTCRKDGHCRIVESPLVCVALSG
jgi:hypothetical protein